MRLTYLFILIIIGSLVEAQTSERRRLEEERNTIIDRIDKQESLLAKTKAEGLTALGQYARLKEQINNRETLLDNLVADSTLLQIEIDSLIRERDKLTTITSRDQATYKILLKTAYIKKLTGIRWLDYLSKSSINEAIRKYWYESQLIDTVQRAKAEINDQTIALDAAIVQLQDLQTTKKAVTAQAKEAIASMQRDLASLDVIQNGLSKKENQLRRQLDVEQKKRRELNRAIERVILDKIQGSSSRQIKLSEDNENLPRTILKPLVGGQVTASFGQQAHASIPNVQINRTGITITSQQSGNVRCVSNGVVASVTTSSDNTTIIVIHGDYYSVYSRIDRTNVNKGQSLQAGEAIGQAQGSNGGWSLDFEWWQGKQAVDPEKWW